MRLFRELPSFRRTVPNMSVGKLIGMMLGGGAVPREAARARANNGCWPMLLVPLIAILIFGVLLVCGIFELRIEFKR